MELWMYATRIPAISKYELSTDPDKISKEMNTKIPISIRQIADKYDSSIIVQLQWRGDEADFLLATIICTSSPLSSMQSLWLWLSLETITQTRSKQLGRMLGLELCIRYSSL